MTKLLLVLILTISIQAQSLLKLHVSKNHTFIAFIESLAQKKYVSTVPRTIYLSKYKNDLDKFINLHNKVSKSRIKNYKDSNSLLQAFYMESLKTNTFNELKNKIKNHNVSIGDKELKRYLNYLSKLYPRFEKILWKKTHRGVLYRKNKLQKMMKDKHFDSMVNQILTFYNVKAKDVGIMDVAFYPISYGSRINAYSMGNIETIGIFVGRGQNLNWMLSATILHELEHTIYRKSKFVKENFLNIKDKKKNRIINEVFATAIGAGWGYKKLTNKYPTRNWYANKIYNKYAKLIYPKVKDYLDNGKKIDKEFVKYIKSFDFKL